MSDNLPDKKQNEEVDLSLLFTAIGNLFDRLFSFISKVFKTVFSLVIFSLKPVVNNFKLLAIVLMTALVLGFVSDKYFKDPVYVSNMLVRPYYDSKYQLSNNVDYFNALIGSENYSELSRIFEIDSSTTAKALIGFEIEIGPETQNDLIKEYDEYIKSLDSTIAVEVTYEDFIENRDILAGSIFSIIAKASESDVFPSLEKGFVKTLENSYSLSLKERTDSIRNVQKQTYLEELQRIQKLQETYLKIKEAESNKGEVRLGAEGIIPLMQEKTQTREYELFQEELKIRNALQRLDADEIEQSQFYDILSSFEEVGTTETDLYSRFTLVFPALAFLVMFVAFVTTKLFKFIKDYE